jgi:3-oxoacyl-[acyl-carrier-protein] synthase-3
MKGNELFRVAVDKMSKAAQAALAEAQLRPEQIGLVIPHQANIRIIQAVARHMKLPEDKFYVNIDRYGNTSAASIPIALGEAVEAGRVKPGDYVLLAAFGAGLTWGAAVLQWGAPGTPHTVPAWKTMFDGLNGSRRKVRKAARRAGRWLDPTRWFDRL